MLLSFGDDVEVIRTESVREKNKKKIREYV